MRGGLAIVAIVVVFAAVMFFGGHAAGVWDGPLPGASAASAEEDSQSGAVPVGWTLHRVRREGFALALPNGWDVARRGEARARMQPLLRSAPPGIRSVMRATARGFALIGVGDRSPPLHATVNVVVAPGPRPKSVPPAMVRELLGIRGRMEHRRLDLPAGEVLRLGYHLGRGSTAVAMTQYVFWRRGRQYVVTFAAPASESATYEAIFRESAESFRFLRPRPVKNTEPAVDPAEARWIREANALCRRARRELERLPQPRTPEDAVELLEKVGPLNKRYNGEFLAIPAPASFGKELAELRRLFERDERLVARFLVAARERDGGRVLELAGKLEIASRDESAIMGALGAEDCDVYGYGGSS